MEVLLSLGLQGLVGLVRLVGLVGLEGLVGLHGPSGGLLPWGGGGLGVILGGLDLGAGSGLDSTVSSGGWTSDLAAVKKSDDVNTSAPCWTARLQPSSRGQSNEVRKTNTPSSASTVSTVSSLSGLAVNSA